MNRKVVEFARRLAFQAGFDVHRLTNAGTMTALRRTLCREQGVSLIIDGGASYGEYASRVRCSGYEGKIASFEPLAQPFEHLARRAEADRRWECYRYALADREGPARMQVAANSVSSSLLQASARHQAAAPASAAVGVQPVDRVTLDSLIPDVVKPVDRVFLKLDVQGAELAALHGAQDVLAQTVGLEIEVSFVEVYGGQALLPEIMAYIYSRGFACIGIEPVFCDPSTGHWLQGDGLFLRT